MPDEPPAEPWYQVTHVEWHHVWQHVYEKMSGRRPLPATTGTRRNDPSREGYSIEDAISDAIADTLDDEEDPPANTEEACEVVFTRTKRCLNTNRKRTSRHSRIHEVIKAKTISETLSVDGSYTLEECIEMLVMLYDALQSDRDARDLLYTVLESDIAWRENQRLAAELKCTPNEVANIKRRIRRRQNQIMSEFRRRDDEGDSQ